MTEYLLAIQRAQSVASRMDDSSLVRMASRLQGYETAVRLEIKRRQGTAR